MLGSGQSGSNLGIVDYCIVGFIHDPKNKETGELKWPNNIELLIVTY